MSFAATLDAARASKGSIYRRWSSRAELVVDAVHERIPSTMRDPYTGAVRGDLLGLLREMSARLGVPRGETARGLFAETVRNPELMAVVHRRFIDPGPRW